MPQSVYSLVRKDKPTVRLAHDALVLINQNRVLPVCRNCGKTGDLSRDVNSFSVSNTISGIPSASITIAAPRTGPRSYYRDGRCIFQPMQEVQIFAKGRFLARETYSDVEPRYYQVFWGFITQVSVSEGVPDQTITLSCEGMLKWWKISKVAMNPSAGESFVNPTVQMTERYSVFYDLNPYQIIFALAVNFGNIFQTTSLTGWTQLLESLNIEAGNMNASAEAVQQLELQTKRYWANRFASMVGALRLFGIASTGPVNIQEAINQFQGTDPMKGENAPPVGTVQDIYNRVKQVGALKANFDLFSINQFRPHEGVSQSLDAFQSRYSDKFTIARELADGMQYEFYQDMNGEIVFKPPFWNMDVRENNPFSVFEDYDIYDRSMSFNEDQIITRVDVTGSLHNLFNNAPARVAPSGWAVDYKLLQHYGFRPQHLQVNWIRDSIAAFVYAAGWLNKVNSYARTMTISTTFRPEVRLGYPIYIPSIDVYAYVEGISHQFSFGQQARTSLQLTAIRRKYIPSLTSVQESQNAYSEATEIDPSTGHIVGAPDYSMVFKGSVRQNQEVLSTTETYEVEKIVYGNQETSDDDDSDDDVERPAIVSSIFNEFQKAVEITDQIDDDERTEILAHVMGLFSGVWVEEKQEDNGGGTGGSNPTPGGGVVFAGSPNSEFFGDNFDPTRYPISDEKGYELIGSIFPYGRNVILESSGLVGLSSGSDIGLEAGFNERQQQQGNVLSARAQAFFESYKQQSETALVRDANSPLGYKIEELFQSSPNEPTQSSNDVEDTDCPRCGPSERVLSKFYDALFEAQQETISPTPSTS